MDEIRPVFTHERAGRLLAGLGVLLGALLSAVVSPWFLLAVGGTAINLVLSAVTDRCAVKSLLIRMGLPGERDVGRAEAIVADAKAELGVRHSAVLRHGGPAAARRMPDRELSSLRN